MADFAMWATACEVELWEEGTFMRAYGGNRDEAIDSVIEADPVGAGVRSLMTSKTEWTGTAAGLLNDLSKEVTEKVRGAKTWPVTPRALSGRLRRAASFLRKIGIDIEFNREGPARTRTIRISLVSENWVIEPSLPSASSVSTETSGQDNGSGAAPLRTELRLADTNGRGPRSSTARENHRGFEDMDDKDGTDANNLSVSWDSDDGPGPEIL